MDWLDGSLPSSQIILSQVQDLPGLLSVGKSLVGISWHDWCVVEEVDQFARTPRDDDLLLGTLNDGRGVNVIGLLELLTKDVGQLGLRDEGLGFGADKLLLELNNLGRAGILVLELLNLIGDLARDVSDRVLVSVLSNIPWPCCLAKAVQRLRYS